MSEETPRVRILTAAEELNRMVCERAASLGLLEDMNGTRDSRVACDLDVSVGGPAGSFVARCVNISRGGVLLGMKYGDHVVDGSDRVGFAEILQSICESGAELTFGDLGFTMSAEIIRAVDGDPESECPTLLACRFRTPLSDEQCGALRVPGPKESTE